MRREIHAYENDDDTFRVEIFQPLIGAEKNGHTVVKLCKESKTEIPRADINITCYDSGDTEHILYTLTTQEQEV